MKLRKNAIDITGKKFNRLLAVKYIGRIGKQKRLAWEFLCDCGATIRATSGDVRSGHTKSCGCLNSENTIKRNIKTAIHNMSNTPEHRCWLAMHQRCSNKNLKVYPDYGGRGIAVCDKWSDFEVFLSDMGHRPSKRHSLDRIDNDGDYNPENCRWATQKQQTRNRRSTRLIEFNGESRSMSWWAEKIGINYVTLFSRYSHGWSVERMLTEPVHSKGKVS